MIVEVLDWVTDDSSLLLWEFKSWNEGWNHRGSWIFCGFFICHWNLNFLFIYFIGTKIWVYFTLMVLLDLICISFIDICSSCLCMFFMFVSYEKLISYFNLVFFFFFFLVFGGEKHQMGVKRLIYPSFLTEVVTEHKWNEPRMDKVSKMKPWVSKLNSG